MKFLKCIILLWTAIAIPSTGHQNLIYATGTTQASYIYNLEFFNLLHCILLYFMWFILYCEFLIEQHPYFPAVHSLV